MNTDAEQLREFVRRDAESAFAEWVKRHITAVYSAACRETWRHLSAAQGVGQLVFIELARKALSLQIHLAIAGWLDTTVRYVTANPRRGDRRRMNREKPVCAENELLRTSNDFLWEEIRPVLDDAMHELCEDDRDAVLLRFFEGKKLREVGEALCLNENTARTRVDRALKRLQKELGKRGVQSTSSALGAALAVGVLAAPPALTGAVIRSALAARDGFRRIGFHPVWFRDREEVNPDRAQRVGGRQCLAAWLPGERMKSYYATKAYERQEN